ncbi:O-antigen ligase family protein [Clostridium tyrobutyricum]|uniref:O-antigen ligase family protein n=1 Tax=Clostridium tyrobutyricum TaxID=1519 RepID=UPI0030CFAA61
MFIASDAKNWQTYAFGTNVFRTFSIFEHPIVYAVFLLILFWCNKFLVKNNFIRHLLQLNILLNLFFTKSRSVWIALIITVFIYYFKVIILKLKNYNYKITYKKIFITTFGLAVIIIAGYIFQNQISNIFNLIFERIVVITDDSYGDVSRLQRLGTIKAINYYMTNNGITNFLFGNGIGSVNQFMINNPISISGFTTTDNQYLSIFYNFGFMGLAVYVLIIILSIIKFLKGNIKDINSLSILCFLSVSISMFFFESFGWTDIFIFLTLSMLFISVKKDKLYSKYF